MHPTNRCILGRWLAALIFYYSTVFVSFSTVVCVQSNGSHRVEATAANGRCVCCHADSHSLPSTPQLSNQGCVDLPIVDLLDLNPSTVGMVSMDAAPVSLYSQSWNKLVLPFSIIYPDSSGTILERSTFATPDPSRIDRVVRLI